MPGRRASVASFPGPIRTEFYLQRSKEFIDPCSVPRCEPGRPSLQPPAQVRGPKPGEPGPAGRTKPVNTENLATPSQQHIPDLGQHPAQAGAVRDGDDAPAVRTRGLTERYGRRTVVDSLDIDIPAGVVAGFVDRKSTRLKSSHLGISYAV